MAIATSKLLYRGYFNTMPSTFYVPPATATVVITNIVVANTTASAQTFYVNVNGVPILSGVSIAANTSAFFDLKTVLDGSAMGADISGWSSSGSVAIHISGVEII